MSTDRYIHCIYAEDVRPEIGGSFSVIGVYQGGIEIDEIPSTIGKLAIVAAVSFYPRDNLNDFKLEVVHDDVVLQAISPPEEFIEKARDKAKNDHLRTGNGSFLNIVLTIVGLNVEKSGRIFTRVEFDGLKMDGNGIAVELKESR